MFNFAMIWITILFCIYYGILYTNEKILTVGFALFLLCVCSIAELVYRFFTIDSQIKCTMPIAEQEVPLRFEVCIKNKSMLPTGRIKVCMAVKNTWENKEQEDWMVASGIMAGEEGLDFKIVLHEAGNYKIYEKKLCIYSITGLLFLTKKCNTVNTIFVMPKIYPVGIVVTAHTKSFAEQEEIEDFEVRSYQPKDKLQKIHWKLSAKRDELMVKENQVSQACAIVLFVEIESKIRGNAFLEVLASISFALMEAECPHFVAWYSKAQQEIVRIRVENEETYYLFLNAYLEDMMLFSTRDIRMEYQKKYKEERYLHDLCIKSDLQIYQNGEFLIKLNAEKIEDACKELELLL